MKVRVMHLVITALISLALLTGCGDTATLSPQTEVATEMPTTAPQTEEALPEAATEVPITEASTEEPVPVSNWTADGEISPDEYTNSADIDRMKLWWRHDGTSLYLAMEGPTEGWISVGIEPSRGMKDADYLFGFVQDGEAQLWDAFGTAPGGPNHPPDEELGGTNDIVTFAGVETGGTTRFELQIPLNSGDTYDKVLEPGGSYAIIMAMGNKDEYNAFHPTVGRGELVLAD